MDGTPPHRPKNAAERVREWRRCQREDRMWAPTKPTFANINGLVDRGLLALEQSEDRDAVARAIEAQMNVLDRERR